METIEPISIETIPIEIISEMVPVDTALLEIPANAFESAPKESTQKPPASEPKIPVTPKVTPQQVTPQQVTPQQVTPQQVTPKATFQKAPRRSPLRERWESIDEARKIISNAVTNKDQEWVKEARDWLEYIDGK